MSDTTPGGWTSPPAARVWRARWPGGHTPRRSRDHVYLGDRDHATTAPLLDELQLRHDFILLMPWQDEHVIGTGATDPVRRADRNPAAGQIPPLPAGIGIDGILDDVRLNAAIV